MRPVWEPFCVDHTLRFYEKLGDVQKIFLDLPDNAALIKIQLGLPHCIFLDKEMRMFFFIQDVSGGN